MKTTTKEFLKLLEMNQDELFNYVANELTTLGFHYTMSVGEYIYVTGNSENNKPLLTSHLDTVDEHRSTKHVTVPFSGPRVKVEGNIVSVADKASVLGGDDRAGVWIMLQLLRSDKALFYDYLFCCDEEVGGFGSQAFAAVQSIDDLNEYTAIISLDRQGAKEVASYGYDNIALEQVFVDLGYTRVFGSFTDCCNISEMCDVACVNLSVGYVSEHTASEVQDITIMYMVLDLLKTNNLITSLTDFHYTYENKTNYYSGYSQFLSDDKPTPMLCDCCGQHLPLYTVEDKKDDYYLCADCVPFYTTEAPF